MRVAIVGWRGMKDRKLFDEKLEAFVLQYGNPEMVISGGAKGADTMGEQWAKARGIPTLILKPNWKEHGKAAGLKRNIDIVNACTHMIAFPCDEGSGTQDSILKARKLGKIVQTHFISE